MLNQGFVRSVSRFMIPELIARKAILELFRIYNGPGNCPVWMPEIEPIELTLFFAVSKQHVRTIAMWWASWRGTCSRGLWKLLGLRLNWKSMLNELQRVNTAWYIQRYIAINLSCYIPCYIDKVWYTIFKKVYSKLYSMLYIQWSIVLYSMLYSIIRKGVIYHYGVVYIIIYTMLCIKLDAIYHVKKRCDITLWDGIYQHLYHVIFQGI